jgi:hypothetical protein
MLIAAIVVGIVLALVIVGAIVYSVVTTPSNLRGFYGKKFALIAIPGLIVAVAAVVVIVMLLL